MALLNTKPSNVNTVNQVPKVGPLLSRLMAKPLLRLALLRRFWGLFAARCFGQTYQKMVWVRNRHWTLEQLAVKNGACFKSFFNE